MRQFTFTGVDIFDRQHSHGEESDGDDSSEEQGVGVEEFDKIKWNLNASFRLLPDEDELMKRETFRLINSRFLSDGITNTRWPALMKEYLDLLEPGGWLQMVEVDWSFQSSRGVDLPNLRAWWDEYSGALRQMRKDPIIARHLCELMGYAGFEEVRGNVINVPIGGWQQGIGDEERGFGEYQC